MRDNEALKSSSFAASLCMGGPIQTESQSRSHIFGNNELVDIFSYVWILDSVANILHAVLLY